MGKVYVREYARTVKSWAGAVEMAAAMEPGVDQVINTSGTSAQSAAFSGSTRLVRVHADSVVSILFGADPTATTSHARLVAGATEYFGVEPGMKLAVIDNT